MSLTKEKLLFNLLQELSDFISTAVGPRPRLCIETEGRGHEALVSSTPSARVVIAIMREAKTAGK